METVIKYFSVSYKQTLDFEIETEIMKDACAQKGGIDLIGHEKLK